MSNQTENDSDIKEQGLDVPPKYYEDMGGSAYVRQFAGKLDSSLNLAPVSEEFRGVTDTYYFTQDYEVPPLVIAVIKREQSIIYLPDGISTINVERGYVTTVTKKTALDTIKFNLGTIEGMLDAHLLVYDLERLKPRVNKS